MKNLRNIVACGLLIVSGLLAQPALANPDNWVPISTTDLGDLEFNANSLTKKGTLVTFSIRLRLSHPRKKGVAVIAGSQVIDCKTGGINFTSIETYNQSGALIGQRILEEKPVQAWMGVYNAVCNSSSTQATIEQMQKLERLAQQQAIEITNR